MTVLTIPIKLLDANVRMPEYAHAGDAGVDLYAAKGAILAPFERIVLPLGFQLAIPDGYAGLVLPRSGLSTNHGITVVNAPGLIDSNYRGEIKVGLVNLDAHETFTIQAGDRIAQLVIISVPHMNFAQTSYLDETVRGDGGFGSSGL